MSEYQFYRFERVTGVLSAKEQQTLRTVSTRADITPRSFSVFYHWGDLKAEPETMMQHFDTGVYYANWGTIFAWIKVPSQAIPSAYHAASDDCHLSITAIEDHTLLTFSIEEFEHYFDDDDAHELIAQLCTLRSELINGDYRLLYFPWLIRAEYDDELPLIPLVQFDFTQMTPAQYHFANLFGVPENLLRALTHLLRDTPSHLPNQTTDEAIIASLTDKDKSRLIETLFAEGSLTREQAMSMLRTPKPTENISYEYWLSDTLLTPHIDSATQEVHNERKAKQAAEKAAQEAKENARLSGCYNQRKRLWEEAEQEASRGCASGYDNAKRTLKDLASAYRLKGEQTLFEQRFSAFKTKHNRRPALQTRLKEIW